MIHRRVLLFFIFIFFVLKPHIAWGQTPVFDSVTSVAAPFADQLLDTWNYAVPLGWGYMDPNIVSVGTDWYATIFYPCEFASKHIYCIKISKNGQQLSPELRFDQFAAGTQYAYQPPMVFYSNGELLLAHWAHGTASQVVLASLSLTDFAQSQWQLKSIYSNVSYFYNYLGGAIGPQGEVVIAGWESGAADNLRVIRSFPPYTTWQDTIIPGQKTLYTHVAVNQTGEIALLTTFGNMNTCPDSGVGYTNYKNVVLYIGTFGNFTATKSDAASDVVTNPPSGNPCAWRNMRFPIDLVYDQPHNRYLYSYRSSEITGGYVTGNLNSNYGAYTQKYPLVASDGTVSIPDVSINFAAVMPDPKQISGIKISTSGGKYVLIATSYQNSLAAITTSDFQTFSSPILLNSPIYGFPTYLSQPYKNRYGVNGTVHLWYGGAPMNIGEINGWLTFRHTSVTVPNTRGVAVCQNQPTTGEVAVCFNNTQDAWGPVTANEWIGLYPATTTPDKEHQGVWKYLTDTKTPGIKTSGQVTFSGLTPGTYEARFFLNNGYERVNSLMVTVGAAASMQPSPTGCTFVPGDVNHDCLVNQTDAQAVLASYAGQLGTGLFEPRVDGKINAFDFAQVVVGWGY